MKLTEKKLLDGFDGIANGGEYISIINGHMKTKRDRLLDLYERLQHWGISRDDIDSLLRVEKGLSRWSAMECGTDAGAIMRDEKTGKPFFQKDIYIRGEWKTIKRPIRDLEKSYLARLNNIMSRYPQFIHYIQSDPRGCAVYIIPRDKIPAGVAVLPWIDSNYSSVGCAVCVD